jgi:hypothetical protein
VKAPLSVVCWRWQPQPGYRSEYSPETVNTLKRMVRRHYPDPHRFICVTDDPVGLDPDVEVVPIWNDHAGLKNPHGAERPACYRRLKAFAPDIGDVLGPRFVSIDLDCVILGDLRPLWNRPEPFVGLQGTHARNVLNGSMFMLTAGAKPHVWQDFCPKNSPALARSKGYYGSDQAWMSFCLRGEPRWSYEDGVFVYRLHVVPAGGKCPEGARIVFFAGKKDPWSPDCQQLDWVREHYR